MGLTSSAANFASSSVSASYAKSASFATTAQNLQVQSGITISDTSGDQLYMQNGWAYLYSAIGQYVSFNNGPTDSGEPNGSVNLWDSTNGGINIFNGKTAIGPNLGSISYYATNSLDVIGNVSASVVTASLNGTASMAVSSSHSVTSSFSTTSSYATNGLTASFAISSSHALTSSYAVTASYANNSTTASNAVTSAYSQQSLSSSFATTASYAYNVPATSSFAVSSSHAITSSFAFTASALVPNGKYQVAFLSASGDINVVGNLNVLDGAISYVQNYGNTYLSMTPVTTGNAAIIQMNGDNSQDWQLLANGANNSAGSGVWIIYDALNNSSPIEIFNPQITGTSTAVVLINGTNSGVSDLIDDSSALQVLGNINITGNYIGNLTGNADTATNATFAANAGFASSATTATSATTSTSSSYAYTASMAISSSHAITASYSLNAVPTVSASWASSSISSSFQPDITDDAANGAVGILNPTPYYPLDVYGPIGDSLTAGHSSPTMLVGTGKLVPSNGVTTANWETQKLSDQTTGYDRYNWSICMLYDSASSGLVNSIDTGQRLFYSSSGQPVASYQKQALYGQWTGSMSNSQTASMARQMPYSSSITSLNPIVATGSMYLQTNTGGSVNLLYIWNGLRWTSCSLA